MKRTLGVFAVAAVSFVVLGSCVRSDHDAAREGVITGPRPIVILAIDGLRADALGAYGAVARTPVFDALAAESIRFEWAFAQAPHIQPSLATLFSGLYPTANGLRQPGEYLADGARTLAEILGAAGYSTAAFMEGSPADSDRGLAQGFDSYQITATPGDEAISWMADHSNENFLLVFGGWSRPALEKVNALLEGDGAPEMSGRVQEVMASRAGDTPLSFTDEELEWVSSWYAARIQVIDSLLVGFMATFRELGLDQRAVLVVLGSNGFALQEHAGLFGETLDTAVTHVPVLIRLPGGEGAKVISKVTEVVDLMPTLLELAGGQAPGGTQGSSLLPIINGSGTPPYIAFAESPQAGGQRFVALGGMGLLSESAGENAGIYDLIADPLQLDDLAETEADKLGVMVRHLQAWEKMVAATSLDPNLRSEEDLDEETLKQLKSLGYIQ